MKAKTLIIMAAMFGLLVTVLLQPAGSVQAQMSPGDCNADGNVDSADIEAARVHIFDNDPIYLVNCDANEDGSLDAADLTCIPLIADGRACVAPNAHAPLGTNLDKIADYSSEYLFIDAFKSSRPWVPRDSAWNEVVAAAPQLDLDDSGWIRSLPDCADTTAAFCHASTYLFKDLNGNYPASTAAMPYIVEHDGEGKLGFGGDAVVNWAQSSVLNGHYELIVTPNNGFDLHIDYTDPNGTGDYIHNIRVYLPGYQPGAVTETFHPTFLESIENYKTLRFMDWMRTNWVNGSPELLRQDQSSLEYERSREVDGSLPRNLPASTPVTWANRPEITDARYSTDDGAPVELMVELANTVSADPWFTLSHQVDDNYATEFATYVRDNLGAHQRVYLEYSNEIWNSGFDQGSWMEAEGVALYGSGDNVADRLNFYGMRLGELCTIWKTVWGSDSDRVTCVAGMQSNNGAYPWVAKQVFECPLAGGNCGANVDAIAIAPYIAAHLGTQVNEAQVETWTVDDVFEEINDGGLLTNGYAGGELQRTLDAIDNWAGEATSRSKQLVAYEGGQHLAGVGPVRNNAAITTLFGAANRHPDMGDVYTAYLDAWRMKGGEMFVHFQNTSPYTQYGNWGAQEFYNAPQRPKWNALQLFMTNNDCWWTDCETPTTMLPTAELEIMPQSNSSGLQQMPVLLETNNRAVSSVAFTLAYDTNQISFDDTNSDADNVPDAIMLGFDSAEFNTTVEHTPGFIAIEITDKQPRLAMLDSGALITVTFDINPVSGTGVTFTNPSFGDASDGHPTSCGDNYGQPVACTNSGSAFLGVPTAVTLQTVQTVASRPNIGIIMFVTTLACLTIQVVSRQRRQA